MVTGACLCVSRWAEIDDEENMAHPVLLRGGGLFTRERIYLCAEESKQEAIMKGEIKHKEGKTQSSGLRKKH